MSLRSKVFLSLSLFFFSLVFFFIACLHGAHVGWRPSFFVVLEELVWLTHHHPDSDLSHNVPLLRLHSLSSHTLRFKKTLSESFIHQRLSTRQSRGWPSCPI
jgi:hypothetical protein